MLSTAIASVCILTTSLGPFRPHLKPMSSVRSVPASSVSHMTGYSHELLNGNMTDEERQFIGRINVERAERGLYALIPDPHLSQVARAHSYDMCVRDYFSHIAPTARLRSPMDRYLFDLQSEGQSMPNHLTVGENIYYCSATREGYDVAYADQALMNSPEHRANILDPRFSRVGIGIWRDEKGEIWVTENFLCETN